MQTVTTTTNSILRSRRRRAPRSRCCGASARPDTRGIPPRGTMGALGDGINRDPIGEDGGVNLYGFVRNNSVKLMDPHGKVAVDPTFAWNAYEQFMYWFEYDVAYNGLAVGSEQWIAMQGTQTSLLAEAATAEAAWIAEAEAVGLSGSGTFTCGSALPGEMALTAGTVDSGTTTVLAWEAGAATETAAGVGAAEVTGLGLGTTCLAVAGAAAVGGAIGYGASQLPVYGGGTVADFWGGALYDACPTCWDWVFW